jgi:hypothetical protein
MALPGAASPPEQQIALLLDLFPGDIIFSEMPFVDAQHEDFTHFKDLSPGHTCVWVNGDDVNAFVRSHHEGYQPPGLTFTGLWPGRHAVYRYTADADIAKQFAEIMKNWACLSVEEKQGKPSSGRHEPRPFLSAANDLFALFKNQNLANLGSEGLRRAIKFASRRALVGEPEVRKAQRCTAVVAAAFQASILASIVKHHEHVSKFRHQKGSLFLEYADHMLETGWRQQPLGERLLKAASTNDYSAIFPTPFALDQRYATPKSVYQKLREAVEFSLVGHYSYFNNEILAVEKSAIQVKTLGQTR